MKDPVTPSNTPSFYLQYALTLPTFLLGICLNLWTLFKIFSNRQELSDTIDYIVTALIAVCLLWSLSCVSRMIALLFVGATVFMNTAATLEINIVITLLLGIQSLLALERFFIVRQEIPKSTVSATLSASMAFTGCIVVIFSSERGIWPDDSVQFWIWVVVVSVGFIVALTVVLFCYYSTYNHIRKSLKAAMNHHGETLRILLERRVLVNCLMMSASVIVCYVPQIIYFTLLGFNVFGQNQGLENWMFALQLQFVAFDPVLAPLLVMCFMKPSTGDRRDSRECLDID
ncbi:hypothetical protein BDR26DRAFT_868746 [Obelidium mucronatum]|nr:hypothetical protein BDR26DRAFT_868746 [Obelidium mucronatum]